jgi:hypothetical protein
LLGGFDCSISSTRAGQRRYAEAIHSSGRRRGIIPVYEGGLMTGRILERYYPRPQQPTVVARPSRARPSSWSVELRYPEQSATFVRVPSFSPSVMGGLRRSPRLSI